ncbi:adenylyltransferase/cytidyltransferase family protein [Patescibacteria group bacterium]|nr:adenylyltransferase/cytidyltransferase family protein [Patescibacteria group bacterium]
MRNKIKTLKEIIKIVNKQKRKGKKIVTINGSFDLLHIGHITAFKEAKSHGDVLIVLLNSDKSVQSYKGPNRPIISQKYRAETLAVVEFIDYITIFNEINPKKILNIIKPNIHCNSFEWGKDCIEKETVEKNSGKVIILKKHVQGFSTSKMIDKVIFTHLHPSPGAVFLDKDSSLDLDKDYVPTLKKLSKSDYKTIIISNQHWPLKKIEKRGIRIDKVYYCPGHSKGGGKLDLEILRKAVKDFGLSLRDSWIIGDKEEDMMIGREANLNTIEIKTDRNKKLDTKARYIVDNLLKAVNIILNN